jgi:hypothetical protein
MTAYFGFGGFGLGRFSADDFVLSFGDLTNYYINLLIVQYHDMPKAKATVGVFCDEAVGSGIIGQVKEGFDLDVAVGAQLDILGQYRGVQRAIYGLDLSRPYFSMPFVTDPNPETYPGFAFITDVAVGDYWLTVLDTNRPIYAMNDDELRRIIKLRAKTQSRFLSLEECDAILNEFFGTNLTLTDNGDMTITYYHSPSDSDTLYNIAVATNSLPKPAGVQLILT